MNTRRRDPLERFWAMVEKSPEPDGCWLWTGTLTDGYPQFKLPTGGSPSQRVYGHRWIYEQLHGPVPSGLLVCHSCDVRRCVRDDHFFLGTNADNLADMAAKGRARNGNSAKLACKNGHPFTPENTRITAKGGRECVTCAREYQAQYYRDHKRRSA